MKVLLISFCFLFNLFFCHAYVEKKFVRRNVENQFDSPFGGENGLSKDATVEGITRLTTSLLHDIHLHAGWNFNIVLSPISIWTILAVLLEGAGGQTEMELKAKLNVSYANHEDGLNIVRSRYNEVKTLFEGRNSQTQCTSLNFLITDKKLSPEFQKVLEEFYDGKYFQFDPAKRDSFPVVVNGWAADKSFGRIKAIVSPASLDNLVMLIGNVVYFKSKWKHPFDPLDTFSIPFKDESGKVLASIPMMNAALVLPHGYNSELEAQIVEIPYADDLASMIVILPSQKVGLRKVLARMNNLSIRQIIPENITEETVQLTLPRFRVVSKMYLNEVLRPDVPSIFSSQSADFKNIGKDIFVSRISHRAEIENTEEGTTASAISSVQFAYKSSSGVFRADRPFVYLINDVKTRTILFAGTFSNPNAGLTKQFKQ